MKLVNADALESIIGFYMTENAYLNDTPLDILKMMVEWIDEQPTIEPKQEWIRVKERLPEQYSFVLSFNGLGVGEAFFDGWRFLSACEEEALSTTHWMPLPEPPKGDE